MGWSTFSYETRRSVIDYVATWYWPRVERCNGGDKWLTYRSWCWALQADRAALLPTLCSHAGRGCVRWCAGPANRKLRALSSAASRFSPARLTTAPHWARRCAALTRYLH